MARASEHCLKSVPSCWLHRASQKPLLSTLQLFLWRVATRRMRMLPRASTFFVPTKRRCLAFGERAHYACWEVDPVVLAWPARDGSTCIPCRRRPCTPNAASRVGCVKALDSGVAGFHQRNVPMPHALPRLFCWSITVPLMVGGFGRLAPACIHLANSLLP